MFGLLFLALVATGLLSTAFHIAMRIRLMRMDEARDRIEWLSFRSSTEVAESYQTLFPHSILPRFCRFAFWIFIAFAAVVLTAIILKSK